MASGNPVITFDNDFNRLTTNNMAFYFNNSEELQVHLNNTGSEEFQLSGLKLKDYALKTYNWKNLTEPLMNVLKKQQKIKN
jgi:hypothetical protein